MAAFEKIKSGFPEMDEILDHIRLGDNVVWQVSDIEEFRFFAEAFARQAVRDGRNIVYVRFAQHEPVLRDLTGIKVRRFDPDDGFEAFTVAIREEIAKEGRDAFYVFDCLSELQSVWYTDLMMGNFFRVTCPYLFELDTVAYFPLLRGRHSFDAVARIRDTTQLLLDVYSGDKGGDPTEGSGSSDPGAEIYLHPIGRDFPHDRGRSRDEPLLSDHPESFRRIPGSELRQPRPFFCPGEAGFLRRQVYFGNRGSDHCKHHDEG